MKPRKNRFFRSIDFRSTPCSRIFVACLAVSAIQLSSSASAADFTWADSAGNTTWTSDASWVGGTAPDNSSSVNDNTIFTSVSNAQPDLTQLTRINGVDFQMADGGLNFTGAQNFLVGAGGIDATGQLSGTNTVAVGNIQLNSASTWNLFSTTNNPSTSTFTIDSSVNLNGNNLTINGKRNNTAGNVGVINFNGVISGNATISVYPDNFRTQTYFTALNAYTGTTNIRGFLNVNSLANAGTDSALGSDGNIVIGQSGSSAQLVFASVAADSTTDRRILFQGTSSGGQFALVNNSLTGSVSFTNPDTIGAAAGASPATEDFTIRFGGTNTGPNTFAQVIDNRTNTTGITNLQKLGAGRWILAGNNAYTGSTTVSAGTLTMQNDQSAATGGWNIQTPNTGGAPVATVNFSAGSTVAVASTNKIQIGAAANSGSHPASTLNVASTVTNSGTLQLERASNVNLNSGAVWTQGGNLTVTGRGGSSATLNVNAGSDMTYSGSDTVKLSPSGGSSGNGSLNINNTGRFTTAAGFENIVSNTNTGNGRINLTNGGTLRLSADVANLTNEVNFNLGTGGGVIDNDGFDATLNGSVTAGYGTAVTGITGSGSLTSTGSGTLTLTGLNTYSGDTTVSSGTLTLDQINDSNEASTVSIAAGAVLNLTFDGTDTVDKLFLNDVQQPVGVYGSGNSGGRIDGTGTLTVSSGPASGYSSWITGFGLALADQDPSADPDNDGMNNLVEFVLNGNPSISDTSILPELVVTSTDFEFTYQRRNDSVSPETTQTFQWGTTLATWPGSAVIPATSGTVGVATITVSPGIPDDAVTDTVKISIPKTEAGASGTLFGRQQVVKP